MDDKQRIALVETRTQGNDGSPAQLIRYQFGNHLGSASLELDDQAQIISYEEYTPYGSTSYQAVRSQTETPKRYRYTGKERDEESGLYYHGARYYAPWLARWVSCDPSGLLDGVNPCTYVKCNPIRLGDPSGRNSFEDLAQFIRNQAGFEQGARNPPTIDLTSAKANASPFGSSFAWNCDRCGSGNATNWLRQREPCSVRACYCQWCHRKCGIRSCWQHRREHSSLTSFTLIKGSKDPLLANRQVL